jgi:hypothetical protein
VSQELLRNASFERAFSWCKCSNRSGTPEAFLSTVHDNGKEEKGKSGEQPADLAGFKETLRSK